MTIVFVSAQKTGEPLKDEVSKVNLHNNVAKLRNFEGARLCHHLVNGVTTCRFQVKEKNVVAFRTLVRMMGLEAL